MNTEVMFSSKTDKWATPQYFFDELNKEFGFTLDPCADSTNHKCEIYFDEKKNGLMQNWGGYRVYCNPPYGSEIKYWIKKAYDETQSGKCELVVMLIPARTDTRWFHDYIYQKSCIEVRFIKGRLKFGNSKNSAPFPSMVVIFRNKLQ